MDAKKFLGLKPEEIESLYTLYRCSSFRPVLARGILVPYDLGQLTYKQILDLKSFYQEQPTTNKQALFDPVIIVTGCAEDQLLKVKASSLVAANVHIENDLTRIVEWEAKNLDAKLTPEEERAGVGELAQFGQFNIISSLADGKPWNYEKVLECEYNDILATLLRNKKLNQIEKRLSENRSPKK